MTHAGSTFVQVNYISVPILSRTYPTANKQFCFFWGFKLGYLIDAKFKFRQEKEVDSEKFFTELEEEFDKIDFVGLDKISEPDKIRRFQLDMLWGIDYEFASGPIIGLSYSIEFIKVIKAGKDAFSWTLHPSLGYNLAKWI